MTDGDEPSAIAARYARRAVADRYSALRPDVWQSIQERQRAMLQLFARLGWKTLADKRLLEIGCGSGGNLLELLRLGFAPEHLVGIELLPARFAAARHALPAALVLHEGDALQVDIAIGSHDVVFVSTVFSSLLDEAFQQRLADAMWRWVKPGGGVLWYDFTVNNPHNADVRGVPLARAAAGTCRDACPSRPVPSPECRAGVADARAGLGREARMKPLPTGHATTAARLRNGTASMHHCIRQRTSTCEPPSTSTTICCRLPRKWRIVKA